jgi:hypothetical protein
VPLYISNFSRALSFPIRVAFATLALLLAYNLLIAVWKPNAVVSYDSNLRNRMIAENYVDFPVAPAVIVGSSMTFLLSRAFMESDDLGSHIYNLALAGRNVATGLDIVLRKPERPRLIFVEVNRLELTYAPDFVEQLYQEPWKALRQVAPGFRLENRPLDIATVLTWSAVKNLFGRWGLEASVRVFAPKPEANNSPAEPASPASAYQAQMKFIVDILGQRVDALRKQGVRIILLRMPVHPATETVDERYKEMETLRRFPKGQYEWLDLQGTGDYQTSDGMHLVKTSARQVAKILTNFADANANR